MLFTLPLRFSSAEGGRCLLTKHFMRDFISPLRFYYKLDIFSLLYTLNTLEETAPPPGVRGVVGGLAFSFFTYFYNV